MIDPASLSIDHLVYGVRNVEAAVDRLEAKLGVRAAMGGRHEGHGTHNALFSLGSDMYFEILGPDPEQPQPAHARPFGLDQARLPRLIAWAAGIPDLEDRVAAARKRGYDPGDVLSMSRVRPDGVRLSWRMAIRQGRDGAFLVADSGLVPFLMSWGETPSPSLEAPGGCELLELRAEHPSPRAVKAKLGALGISLPVDLADSPGLVAVLDTPTGRHTLR